MKTPYQIRRSQLSLENFLKKKEEEKESIKSTVEEPGTQEDKTAELETFLWFGINI